MSSPSSGLETQEVLGPIRTSNEGGDGKIVGRSPMRLAIMRFRRDKLSMISFGIMAFFFLAAILAPFLDGLGLLQPLQNHPNLLNVNLGGIPKGAYGGISWSHPFGVEPGIGRDVLSRILVGISWSLGIGLSATILTVFVGTIAGIIAGFSGGWVDAFVGRFIDLTLSFPSTLMLLAFSSSTVQWMQNSLGISSQDIAQSLYVVVVLASFSWPVIARIIRGQVLSIREREYIEAAKLIGASRPRLYFREILPNLWAPLLVYFTLTVPLNVSAEAALNYLGVGVKPPTPTLGNILSDSVSYVDTDFLFFFLPGLMIAIIVVTFNLVGDGMRDALDPRTHQ